MPSGTMAPQKKNPKNIVPAIVPETREREEPRSRAEGYLKTNVGGTLDIVIAYPSSKTIPGRAIDARYGRNELFSVRMVIKNTGKEPLHNLSLVASGPMVWKPQEVRIAELKPGQSKAFFLSYFRKESVVHFALQKESLKEEWQGNFPVAAKLKFTKGPETYAEEVPVDYLHYSGWTLLPSEEGTVKRKGQELLQMAYAEQPGLLPHVTRARKKAEEYFGGPLDQSPAARVAAAKAVSELLQDLGVRYFPDDSLDASAFISFLKIRNVQYPTETLYYGGDCEDLSILYGFFMHQLGIPFALLLSPEHVQPLVEIYRGRKEGFEPPAGLGDKELLFWEGEEARVYIAVDPACMLGEGEGKYLKENNINWFEDFLSDAKEKSPDFPKGGLEKLKEHKNRTLISSIDQPPGEMPSLGKSWFGELQFIPKKKKKK